MSNVENLKVDVNSQNDYVNNYFFLVNNLFHFSELISRKNALLIAFKQKKHDLHHVFNWFNIIRFLIERGRRIIDIMINRIC